MSEYQSAAPLRELEGRRKFSAKRFFFQWEWMLFLVLIGINVMNICLSPNYWEFGSLMSAIQLFLDKAIMVFPMMLVILMGDIDISVASTMALSSVIMGVLYNAGVPMAAAILVGLGVGTLCGFLNGLILTRFKELPAMIVTLSTMIIYRGIASIILEDQAAGGFPKWFNFLSWGKVGPLPFILVFFIAEAAVFVVFVHKTPFGRRVYAIGNNAVTSRFSGIQVDRIKLIIFTLNGLFAAVAGLFLTSKMGSARPSMAQSYELDVITMVVLGGVSSAGGKGRVVGTIEAIFIIGLLRYGLGLINVPSQTILIIVGALLVVSVAIPNIKTVAQEHGLLIRKAD